MFAAYRQLPQSTAQSTMAILMEAPSAMDILRHYRIPVSVADAHDYLRELTERVGLLGLYQHFFPEEYAASEASLVGGYEGTYSPREVEFSELVNERMFPLELDFEDERLGLIPVYGIGFNGWEWGVEDMSPAWRMMMLLAGEDLHEPVEAWQEHMSKWLDDETVAILHAQVQPLDNLSVERLEGACRDMPPLLSELPRALEVMYRETGHAWLDTDGENGLTFDCTWTISEMEWLRDGYAPAVALLERVTGFLDWLEADGGNMQKVAEWWLRLVGRVSVRA